MKLLVRGPATPRWPPRPMWSGPSSWKRTSNANTRPAASHRRRRSRERTRRSVHHALSGGLARVSGTLEASRRTIVVGSGPSGATAALKLLERGIPVTLLESGIAFPKGLIVRALGRKDLPQVGAW